MHDPAWVDEVVARWSKAVGAGEPFEMEFPLRRHDGVYRWFLTRVGPLRAADGRVVRWVGTNTDVTSLREAEERITTLSQASASFITAKLDLHTLLQTLVDGITPRFAQSCTVVMVGPGEQLEEQVLTNLVGNAIKYGPQKPVVIRVEETATDVRLSVRDEGIGIRPDDLQRIFGRFERAVPTQNYGGLGLGLYIARQIVEAHGGSIAVASEVGAGSTFTVTLPRPA